MKLTEQDFLDQLHLTQPGMAKLVGALSLKVRLMIPLPSPPSHLDAKAQSSAFCAAESSLLVPPVTVEDQYANAKRVAISEGEELTIAQRNLSTAEEEKVAAQQVAKAAQQVAEAKQKTVEAEQQVEVQAKQQAAEAAQWAAEAAQREAEAAQRAAEAARQAAEAAQQAHKAAAKRQAGAVEQSMFEKQRAVNKFKGEVVKRQERKRKADENEASLSKQVRRNKLQEEIVVQKAIAEAAEATRTAAQAKQEELEIEAAKLDSDSERA